MLTIETTRFSATVMAFIKRYPSAIAKLAKRIPTGDWCTNAKLETAIDFSLTDNGTELLGFHDGPCNMWAADEALSLVQELAKQHILRYR